MLTLFIEPLPHSSVANSISLTPVRYSIFQINKQIKRLARYSIIKVIKMIGLISRKLMKHNYKPCD